MVPLSWLAVAGMLLAADAPASDELKLEVRRYVRQLDADDLAERDAAEAALVALGPPALDLLPELSDRLSAESKQRLGRILQKLQRATAEAAAQPTAVTLDAKAMPLAQVLAAIEQQTGNKIVDYRQQFGQQPTDPPLTLSFKQTPFWQALDETLDQAEMTVYAYGEDRGLHIVGRTPRQAPRSGRAFYSGPFRFEATGLTAERNLRVPELEALNVDVEVAWEPRVKPISLRQALEAVKAVDENGAALAVGDASSALETAAGDDSTAVKLTIPFKLPARPTRQIAELKSTLQAILPGKVETFRFGDLATAKDVEKRVAGVAVTLEGIRKNNDLWQVRMRVTFDEAGEALATHRGWVFKNDAFLEDAAGKRHEYDVFETTRQSSNEIGIAYGFVLDKAPDDMTFVYKTPGVLIATGFDYELKNLELP
jgi:hypothetical protein